MTLVVAVSLMWTAAMSLGLKWWKALRLSMALVAVPGVLYVELLLTNTKWMGLHAISVPAWSMVTNWDVLYGGLAVGAITYGSFAYGPLKRLVAARLQS